MVSAKTAGPRILTLDIETAPLESYHWGLFDQNIGLNQIKTEWTVLSVSAKWLGEKKVLYFDTGGRGAKRVRDDFELLKKLWVLLEEADIVVGQNAKEFDLKKIHARMLMHGLPPYSPVRVVDTFLAAKRHFGFTSNKLEWLSKLTKTKKRVKRTFAGFELWKECLADNAAAWKEMRLYNSDDVLATEELYLKLRPWIENHPNVAAYGDATEPQCPKCGSFKLKKRGFAYTQSGQHQRYECLACGGCSKAKGNLAPKAKRGALLGN